MTDETDDDCSTPAGSCAIGDNGGCGTSGVILPDNPVDNGTWVCGTGNLSTVVPPIGDPTYGEVTLVAQGGLDQITVRWTWPSKFPQGVAFCTLYRGTGANVGFGGCSRLAEVGGNIYTDPIKSDLDPDNIAAVTNYTYWVKFTSVNGVVSEPYGPAWAFPYDTVQSVLDGMENRILATQLSNDLRTEIDRITDISSGLSDEHQNRLFGDSYLSAAWGAVDRTMADIDAKIVAYQDTIVTEEMAMAVRISGLFTVFEGNAAAITNEQIAISNANKAVAGEIKTLEATYKESVVLIQQLFSVQAGKKPVLDSITGYPVFPAQYYDTNEEALTAQYSLKTDVKNADGTRLVTGFGLYNDGTNSEFIVNATDFAVGLVKPYIDTVDGESPIPPVYPFVVGYIGGKPVVSMNAKTFIQDGTIVMANIADKISSTDYVYKQNGIGGKGWALFQGLPQNNPKRTDAVGHPHINGWPWYGVNPEESWADFANVRVRGDVEANSISANAVNIVKTLNIAGDAVSVGSSRVYGWVGAARSDGRLYRFTGSVLQSVHQGGRIGLDVSYTQSGNSGGDAGVFKMQVEIYFNDGTLQRRVKLSYSVQGDSISFTVPVSLSHASKGGVARTILWEVGIYSDGGTNPTLANCGQATVTTNILKR